MNSSTPEGNKFVRCLPLNTYPSYLARKGGNENRGVHFLQNPETISNGPDSSKSTKTYCKLSALFGKFELGETAFHEPFACILPPYIQVT